MSAVTTLFSVFSDQLDMKDNSGLFAATNLLASGFQRLVNRRIGISGTRGLGLLRVLTSGLSNFSAINEGAQARNE